MASAKAVVPMVMNGLMGKGWEGKGGGGGGGGGGGAEGITHTA